MRICRNDHAKKISVSLDWLRFEEIVLHEGDAVFEVGRDDTVLRVLGVSQDAGQVLYDALHFRCGFGDGDTAVARVATNVDDRGFA